MGHISQRKGGPDFVQPMSPADTTNHRLWFNNITDQMQIGDGRGWGAVPIPPVLQITAPTAGDVWNHAAALITLSGTVVAGDNPLSTIQYFVEGANPSEGVCVDNGNGTWTLADLTVPAGVSRIIIRALDNKGYFGTDVLTITVSDLENPVVNIDTPTSSADGALNVFTTSIEGVAEDDVAITALTYAVTGATNLSGACIYDAETKRFSTGALTFTAGQSVIIITATDAAAKTGADSLTLSIDTQNPICTITSPTTSPLFETNQGSVTVGGTAADNGAIDRVEYAVTGATTLNGTAIGTSVWQFNLTLNEGAHTIAVTAYDMAGNAHTDTLSIVYSLVADLGNINITADTLNVDLRQKLLDAGWNGTEEAVATVTVKAGVKVGSTLTSTPAIITGDLTNATVTLVIEAGAYVVGHGGSGGYQIGGAGGAGGPAIQATSTLTIDNLGTIGGGGGGGGWGESGTSGSIEAGGGGGGGAGYVPGNGGNPYPGLNPGIVGTLTAGGNGGPGRTFDLGVTGAGGKGGSLGAAGSAGLTGTYPGVGPWGGGARGAYLTGSVNVTWTNTGQRLGSVS